jgi:ribonuclease P/MRP protein subunit POP8
MASDTAEPPPASAIEKPGASSHLNTLRRPQWTYFHLSALRMDGQPNELDIITVRQNLNTAMNRFLGLMGTSVPIVILKLETEEFWVRVPRDASNAFHEAVSSWTGNGQVKYLIKGKDDWLAKLAMGFGQDLF